MKVIKTKSRSLKIEKFHQLNQQKETRKKIEYK